MHIENQLSKIWTLLSVIIYGDALAEVLDQPLLKTHLTTYAVVTISEDPVV